MNGTARYFLHRVRSHSKIDEETGCREWNTAVGNYPKLWVDGKPVSVSRKIYEIIHGEITSGLIVRHKCDNTQCVNINHLVLGTHQDNRVDRVVRQGT